MQRTSWPKRVLGIFLALLTASPGALRAEPPNLAVEVEPAAREEGVPITIRVRIRNRGERAVALSRVVLEHRGRSVENSLCRSERGIRLLEPEPGALTLIVETEQDLAMPVAALPRRSRLAVGQDAFLLLRAVAPGEAAEVTLDLTLLALPGEALQARIESFDLDDLDAPTQPLLVPGTEGSHDVPLVGEAVGRAPGHAGGRAGGSLALGIRRWVTPHPLEGVTGDVLADSSLAPASAAATTASRATLEAKAAAWPSVQALEKAKLKVGDVREAAWLGSASVWVFEDAQGSVLVGKEGSARRHAGRLGELAGHLAVGKVGSLRLLPDPARGGDKLQAKLVDARLVEPGREKDGALRVSCAADRLPALLDAVEGAGWRVEGRELLPAPAPADAPGGGEAKNPPDPK
ncbi:MAG: hypothetical protein HYZ53_16820 [Planctomycetes bacterium]|nr:hypothetical protein [Planctomycetota bacterium]